MRGRAEPATVGDRIAIRCLRCIMAYTQPGGSRGVARLLSWQPSMAAKRTFEKSVQDAGLKTKDARMQY